jgi:pyruvate decarboxylase
MKHLLPKLTAALEVFKERARKLPVASFKTFVPQEDNDLISQSWFWPRVSRLFRPNDVIVTETGTSSFGLIDIPVRLMI